MKLSDLFWVSKRAKNPKHSKKISGLDDAMWIASYLHCY